MNAIKGAAGPVRNVIAQKLTNTFRPIQIDIINESHMHSVPKNSETHFKITIVSDNFQGRSLIEKHQDVYKCLQDEMRSGVHALSLTCRSPAEWEKNNEIAKSPSCLGGSKADKGVKQ